MPFRIECLSQGGGASHFPCAARDSGRSRRVATVVEPSYKSKKQYKHLLAKHVDRLSALQRVHYAPNRYALLLIFQAMDAAGKDGVIRHVMSGVNPQGCRVYSFKHPTPDELCGAPRASCRNAGRSAFSIVHTMKKS